MEYAGAYLVRGSASAIDAVTLLLEKDGVINRSSPDMYIGTFRSFGVEEAERLRERVRLRPVQASRRIFIVAASAITHEAQNALLKTLEEPAADALFFIIVPSPELLLPTVRSRAQILATMAVEGAGTVDPDVFLCASPEKRLVMLKPLYEHDDEGRDIGAVTAFLHALERRLAEREMQPAAFEPVYRALTYVGDRGSLLKALLEQMALLVPKL